MFMFMIVTLSLAATAAARPGYDIYLEEFIGGPGFGGSENGAIGISQGLNGSPNLNVFVRSASLGAGYAEINPIHTQHIELERNHGHLGVNGDPDLHEHGKVYEYDGVGQTGHGHGVQVPPPQSYGNRADTAYDSDDGHRGY